MAACGVRPFAVSKRDMRSPGRPSTVFVPASAASIAATPSPAAGRALRTATSMTSEAAAERWLTGLRDQVLGGGEVPGWSRGPGSSLKWRGEGVEVVRSEEHTSEL